MANLVEFSEPTPSESGKTSIWAVHSTKDAGYVLLGLVKWFGRWRKYAFFPEPLLVFEQDCLRDLADFCQQRSKEHRQRRTPTGSSGA